MWKGLGQSGMVEEKHKTDSSAPSQHSEDTQALQKNEQSASELRVKMNTKCMAFAFLEC